MHCISSRLSITEMLSRLIRRDPNYNDYNYSDYNRNTIIELVSVVVSVVNVAT